MDTTALDSAFANFTSVFGNFAKDFAQFSTDLAAFLKANVPQDTPQQVADVAATVAGLQSFATQVSGMDTTLQGLDAQVNPPAPPPPPAPAAS